MLTLPPQLSMGGSISATKDTQNHSSLYYIIKITEKLVNTLILKKNKNQLLPFKSIQEHDSFVGKKNSSLQNFNKNFKNLKWKIGRFNSNSVLRKGLNTYEVVNFPRTKLVKSFDLGINSGLYKALTNLKIL